MLGADTVALSALGTTAGRCAGDLREVLSAVLRADDPSTWVGHDRNTFAAQLTPAQRRRIEQVPQPFSPLWARPWMKWRWATMNTSSTGTAVRVVAASWMFHI